MTWCADRGGRHHRQPCVPRPCPTTRYRRSTMICVPQSGSAQAPPNVPWARPQLGERWAPKAATSLRLFACSCAVKSPPAVRPAAPAAWVRWSASSPLPPTVPLLPALPPHVQVNAAGPAPALHTLLANAHSLAIGHQPRGALAQVAVDFHMVFQAA